MLFALTSPKPSLSLADFNKWYDERHAPSRAACPGVHSVRRFHLVDGAEDNLRKGDWTWLAMYELESEDALQTEEYKKARKGDGDDESRMFAFLSRRVYKLLDDNRRDDYAAFASSGKSRLISMIGLQPEDTSVASTEEQVEQYKREHATNTSGNDSWLRSSFWQLSTAADPRDWREQIDVPKILVLHESKDSAAVNESSVFREADASRNADALINEKALLILWKQF